MKRKIATLVGVLVALGIATGTAGCEDKADVASENLSKAADNFEVPRRIVVFNGITDKYLLVVEGRCSIDDEGNQLEITCKIADDKFIKDFAGLSDNVSYFVEQTDPINVDEYHYRVIFAPEQILPDVSLNTSGDEDNPPAP
jgi:hypothetical protein